MYLFLKAKMDLKQIILRKLYRRRVIGGKRTDVEHLTKGLPRHLTGAAKNTVKELVKEGFILTKSTSYGLQVSLNPEKIDEITKIIEEWQESLYNAQSFVNFFSSKMTLAT